MFIRKKRNRTGSVSVQIIDKSNGKYRVYKTVGSSKDPVEIDLLIQKGQILIEELRGNPAKLLNVQTKEELVIEKFCEGLGNSNIRTIGPELIFGKLFDHIGFNVVPKELFRHLVISRLAYPTSKLKTIDYLRRYRGENISISTIYRFLDELHKEYKSMVEKIAYQYTKRLLKQITVVFYDMTTLYFEASDEDDLRRIGFSKDGKFQKPQIMLGLLVGQDGYPIGYDLFEGNTAEVKTLIPTLEQIQKKYNFPKPIVIADAGLLSKDILLCFYKSV